MKTKFELFTSGEIISSLHITELSVRFITPNQAGSLYTLDSFG